MIDNYIYVIVALLPLTALMLVFQVNPYDALVIRAILGAVAALVYSVLGAADVALTEALVGTMLAVTLYVVAVRSSLVMRLGILKEVNIAQESYFEELLAHVRKAIDKYHLRLEIVEYPDSKALEQALMTKEVHATCIKQEQVDAQNINNTVAIDARQTYLTTIRVRRLFEIMQTELTFPETTLDYVTVLNKEDQH